MLKACIGLKQIDYIDRRHCGLLVVPEDVYRHERSLEELLLDFNGIQELPPVSLQCCDPPQAGVARPEAGAVPPGSSQLHIL